MQFNFIVFIFKRALNNSVNISAFVAICFLLFSCSRDLDSKEFISWVKDYKNGLHAYKESDPFYFDLQYQPTQYVLLQRNNADVSLSENDEGNLQYYTLTIGTLDKAIDFMDFRTHDFAEQQRKLYYLSYLFQNDIHLEEEGKKFQCILYHFERQADLKPSRTFVLAFEKSKEEVKEAFLVIDSEYLGSLPLKIKVLKENIPSLKL